MPRTTGKGHAVLRNALLLSDLLPVAAKDLRSAFTHRNTVLYRIRRMQEEFAIPLDEPLKHADLLLSVSLLLFEAKGPDFFLPKTPLDNS